MTTGAWGLTLMPELAAFFLERLGHWKNQLGHMRLCFWCCQRRVGLGARNLCWKSGEVSTRSAGPFYESCLLNWQVGRTTVWGLCLFPLMGGCPAHWLPEQCWAWYIPLVSPGLWGRLVQALERGGVLVCSASTRHQLQCLRETWWWALWQGTVSILLISVSLGLSWHLAIVAQQIFGMNDLVSCLLPIWLFFIGNRSMLASCGCSNKCVGLKQNVCSFSHSSGA